MMGIPILQRDLQKAKTATQVPRRPKNMTWNRLTSLPGTDDTLEQSLLSFGKTVGFRRLDWRLPEMIQVFVSQILTDL